MKKYVLALLVFVAFASCKDNPVSKKIKETKDAVSNTTNAVKEMTNMQDDIEELQQMTPLTNEELKSWMPEEVNGMKRISYKAGQAGMMNISSIEATYANEDKSKKFSINIIDGAGQVGAAATMGMRLVMSQDFEEEDENGSRRTVTKNGKKAIEEYRSGNNRSTIQLMEGNRFYLEAKGTNMDIDETWDAIDELDLEKLG
jgi:methylthioribose-1-phosphate isomerase